MDGAPEDVLHEVVTFLDPAALLQLRSASTEMRDHVMAHPRHLLRLLSTESEQQALSYAESLQFISQSPLAIRNAPGLSRCIVRQAILQRIPDDNKRGWTTVRSLREATTHVEEARRRVLEQFDLEIRVLRSKYWDELGNLRREISRRHRMVAVASRVFGM